MKRRDLFDKNPMWTWWNSTPSHAFEGVPEPAPISFPVEAGEVYITEIGFSVRCSPGVTRTSETFTQAFEKWLDQEIEDPCEVTGKACDWQGEEWYGNDGEMESWDLFCRNCGRWRDWSKEEYPAAT